MNLLRDEWGMALVTLIQAMAWCHQANVDRDVQHHLGQSDH